MIDINHLLRPGHLAQLAKILDDPEATANDKFVAYDLLKNANIAAGGVLPMCQDTGTAIVVAKKGRLRLDRGRRRSRDRRRASARAYEKKNLRYSQVAPLSMFEEKNTGDNLPAQIEISAEGEDAYKFLFIAKGGGSANKSFLYPGDAVDPDARPADRVPEGKDPDARHRGLPALSPRDRHRRHQRGTDAEDREARLDPLSRRAADRGRRGRPRVPRSRAGGGDPRS